MAMAMAGRLSATCTPTRPDTAPHIAEPKAKAPSAHEACIAVARPRTQGGALVRVAVLKASGHHWPAR